MDAVLNVRNLYLIQFVCRVFLWNVCTFFERAGKKNPDGRMSSFFVHNTLGCFLFFVYAHLSLTVCLSHLCIHKHSRHWMESVRTRQFQSACLGDGSGVGGS